MTFDVGGRYHRSTAYHAPSLNNFFSTHFIDCHDLGITWKDGFLRIVLPPLRASAPQTALSDDQQELSWNDGGVHENLCSGRTHQMATIGIHTVIGYWPHHDINYNGNGKNSTLVYLYLMISFLMLMFFYLISFYDYFLSVIY